MIRPLASCLLAFLLPAGFYVGVDAVEAAGISPKHHPWGVFKPGAWKLVQVTTETLDDKGSVTSTSITKTKTTLVELGNDAVTLHKVGTTEASGKRFNRGPETVSQGLHGETVGRELKCTELATGQVTIEGKSIPCKVIQCEFSGPGSKTVTKIYYSPTISPHILRRAGKTTDLTGENVLNETSVAVVVRNMPCKVLAEIKTASFVKAVQRHPKGTITTWSQTSTEVPGGIIAQSSKERDRNGRVIRRSTLELLDYGLEPEVERISIPPRRQPRPRLRKPPSW